MKEVIYPVLAFAVILIIGCTNSKKADVKNPPVGAWEHMSTTFFQFIILMEKNMILLLWFLLPIIASSLIVK